MTGGDVEEHQLIGAGVVVRLRRLHGVPRIPQADEPDPFDDPPLVHIETRNDPFRQHRFSVIRVHSEWLL